MAGRHRPLPHSAAIQVAFSLPLPWISSISYKILPTSLPINVTIGQISFEYVVNDGSDEASITLTGLKNIYGRQLPNMPREYIVRLVFDPRHRSVALLRRGVPIGGITYRPFVPAVSHDVRSGGLRRGWGFAEIAFCAVTVTEQIRGFGTRLMNHAKAAARSHDRCEHFLTYADNSAVGYFQKQGFTRRITLPRDVWGGYIKDYDGGTMMECVIGTSLPNVDAPAAVMRQKKALWDRLTSMSDLHLVRATLPAFARSRAEHERDEAARAAESGALLPTPTPVTLPPVDPIDVPGLAEAGWTPDDIEKNPPYLIRGAFCGERRDVPPTPKHLAALLRKAWDELSRHPDAWPFHEPVSAEAVPDY